MQNDPGFDAGMGGNLLQRQPINWSKLKKAELVAELKRRDAAGAVSTIAGHDHLDIWQTLIDAIPAPIFYKDTNHIYRGCNRAFEDYIGIPRENIWGASVYDVAPKELADVYREADDKLFAERGTQVYQAQVKYADGSRHDVMFHKAVYEIPDGSLGGMVGVILDITERVQAETALSESRLMFVKLVENMPDPVFVHDGNGRIIQVNEQACISLGYERSQLLAMNVADIETGANLEDLKAAWSRLTDQVEFFSGRHRRKDGTVFPVEVHVSRVAPEAGDAVLFIASVRDISERQAAETRLMAAKQEAEEASRTKTEFLANMSHELRTPLNAILGFSDIIRDETLGPVGTDAYLEYAGDIHRSGGHLLQIINDLLDLSHLEIGDVAFRRDAVSVDVMVADSLRLLGNAAEKNTLAISTEIAGDLPKLICDPRRITQVLINLIGNAVKFTPADGAIRISADIDPNGAMVIAVTDTGIGIATNDLSKVLMPFEQLQNPMTRKHSGSGLGLALCKSFVEIHDGHLAIASALGEGTTVSITFPPNRLAG